MDKQVIEKIIERLKNFPDSEVNNLIEHIEFLKKRRPEEANGDDKTNNYLECGP